MRNNNGMNLGVVLPRDRFPWGTTFFNHDIAVALKHYAFSTE